MNAEFSRVTATASSLGDAATDRHRFLDKRVLLTGEATFLATENGRDCLLGALRLLPRICANVAVAVPDGPVREEARSIAASVAFGQPIAFLDGDAGATFDAILNVGNHTRADLPWTAINNDGWLVRVTSGDRDLPAPSGQSNPIASLAAASFGAGEVFKRLLGVRPDRGPLLESLSWSLFSYAEEQSDLGPLLPVELPVDLLLAGAGAIGNGIIHLLARLPLRGRVLVVDSQVFARENLGTSILIGEDDVGAPKVSIADRLHTIRLDARGFHETLDDFTKRLGAQLPHPRMILGALDKIDSRHSIQDLWPDLLIDGAIGALLCQVSRHPIHGDVACARCLFRHPAGERAEAIGSRASGLTVDRVAMGEALVAAADIAVAPPEKRSWLTSKVGQPICSVVSEAVARELSQAPRDRFEPSVPFVACIASSMIVAELVKAVSDTGSPLEPRFQFDVLRGPRHGQFLPETRRADCFCTTRAETIDLWRRSRAA